MKEKWKTLLQAMAISAIITGIFAFILFENTSQYQCTEPQAFLMKNIVTGILGDRSYVPFWILGVVSLVCFVFLSMTFYFVIMKLKK